MAFHFYVEVFILGLMNLYRKLSCNKMLISGTRVVQLGKQNKIKMQHNWNRYAWNIPELKIVIWEPIGWCIFHIFLKCTQNIFWDRS